MYQVSAAVSNSHRIEIGAGQRTTTMARRLFGLYFRETYHTGQTELLRQLAGTDDKVI